MKKRALCFLAAATLSAVAARPPAPRLTVPTPSPATPPPATPAPADSASAATSGPRFKTSLSLAEMPPPGKDPAQVEAQAIARDAMAEFASGNLVTARLDFSKALLLAPENPALLINLALIDYRERKFDAAETGLRHVLHTRPETGLAWLILGVVSYDSDKLDAALAALSQAVWLEPKDARAHLYLGVTIGKKGWYSGAEDEMRKALELQPEYEEAHFNLAVFYLQRTPPAVELARRHYLKARALGAPPDEQVEKALGR